jgi:hypothetical protein
VHTVVPDDGLAVLWQRVVHGVRDLDKGVGVKAGVTPGHAE